MYATFIEKLSQAYNPEKIQGDGYSKFFNYPYLLTSHQDGRFGAMMNVTLTNEVRHGFSGSVYTKEADLIVFIQGPVTFTLDSRKFEYVDSARASTKNNTPAS